jgi:deazaflavin-dependent oxidoreductase (nitroreductase family)
VNDESVTPSVGSQGAVTEIVRAELSDDPTIDITTTGRRSGRPRRIEIWMLDVDGRFFITGTPGQRGWLANLTADPQLVVHLKRRAQLDLAAHGEPVGDLVDRRRVLEHPSAHWYRAQAPTADLVERSPMVEVTFSPPAPYL